MNDFTKEELLNLYIMCCSWVGNLPHTDQAAICLQDKLKSMIDGYCEKDTKGIIFAHLKQAESLISHATTLLGFDDE